MNTGVFQRHEIKFLVNASQRTFLENELLSRMVPDAHGESTICNVYYDTPDYRLIRRSLEKPVYKEKIRVRSYGTASPDDTVFLELKKKYKGIVYKRRIELKEKDAEQYLDYLSSGKQKLPVSCQIGREIEYFCQYYGPLVPAVHLCYDRCAFFSKEDPELRITFDRNIRWSRHGLTLTAPPVGRQLLAEGESLLEIKTAGAMPLWLTKVLTEGRIRQISFSKYGLAYETGLMNHTIPARQYQLQEHGGYCYV